MQTLDWAVLIGTLIFIVFYGIWDCMQKIQKNTLLLTYCWHRVSTECCFFHMYCYSSEVSVFTLFESMFRKSNKTRCFWQHLCCLNSKCMYFLACFCKLQNIDIRGALECKQKHHYLHTFGCRMRADIYLWLYFTVCFWSLPNDCKNWCVSGCPETLENYKPKR